MRFFFEINKLLSVLENSEHKIMFRVKTFFCVEEKECCERIVWVHYTLYCSLFVNMHHVYVGNPNMLISVICIIYVYGHELVAACEGPWIFPEVYT